MVHCILSTPNLNDLIPPIHQQRPPIAWEIVIIVWDMSPSFAKLVKGSPQEKIQDYFTIPQTKNQKSALKSP